MHILLPILIALLTSSAASFKIPFEATEGDYVAYFNAEGVEVHDLISEYTVSNASTINTNNTLPAPSFNGRIRKRANWYEDHFYCGCGFTMNPGDCDSAVAALKDQFKSKPNGLGVIQKNSAWYSIRGGVVAFACNEWGSVPFGMTDPFYGDILARITGRCGRYIAGTDRIIGYNIGANPLLNFPQAFIRLGYMRMYNGLDFCAAAIGSGQSSC